MGLRRVGMGAALALGIGTAQAASPASVLWSDPPVLTPGPSEVVSLDAFTGDVDVPGLGRVHGASFYDLRQGAADRPAPSRRSLMPPVLQIGKGSAFELHLHNRLTTIEAVDLGKPHPLLDPDPTNVHTHGLLVPPTGIGFGTPRPHLGDCVLALEASAAGGSAPSHGPHGPHASVLGADPCAPTNAPGMPMSDTLTYSYPIAPDHPSGLFWIHPHPHGQSEIQLSNGLSGLLTIGSVWDSLFFRCRLSASPNDVSGACKTQEEQVRERSLEDLARGGALRVRYFGLKDIQVQPHPGPGGRRAEYDLIPFPHRPAAANQAFNDANDARKSRCGKLPRPQGDDDVIVPGGGPTTQGICRGADGTAWAFTVSGQVFPRIEVVAGSTELWRFANMSADVSYRLQLKGADGTLYRMRPVAIDGVAIAVPQSGQAVGMAAGRKGASTSGAAVAEIVLMPSARIEVVVERCDSKAGVDASCVPSDREVKAVLHTRGMATGYGDKGDLWPAIDLAGVVFRAGADRGAATLAPRQALLPPVRSAAAEPPPEPTPAPQQPPPSPGPAASACPGYEHGPGMFPVGGTQVRLIRLNNATFGDEEAFGIHDELARLSRLSTGAPVTLAALIDEGAVAANGPSVIRDVRLPDPCSDVSTVGGFRDYYRPFDPTRDNVTVKYGTEEYWLVINDSSECHNFHIHQMKFGVIDADFRGTEAALAGSAPIASDQCAGDRTAIRPINQAAFLDNYPLPPAARVLFRVRFGGPKLGRFVFHCHILEHEDKGMMALLNVVE
jgi:FtsP/CotA-like multicopper oxidase with cupredoxin domain